MHGRPTVRLCVMGHEWCVEPQVDNISHAWPDAPRLVHMLWSVTVKGCNMCLFLLLPFAYFYMESSWTTRRRGALGRHAVRHRWQSRPAKQGTDLGCVSQAQQTQWGVFNAWWRQFVGRFITSLVEVLLVLSADSFETLLR